MSKVLYIGIDLQEGFLTDRIRQSGYVERVENFLARQDTGAVLLTRFVNEPGSNFETLMDWPKMQRDDPGTKLFGALETAGYNVVEKSSYTAWVPAVRQKAEALGARNFVLFGLDSDACVLKTALDIFEAGGKSIVLSDLCDCSGGPDRNETGLHLIGTLIGNRQLTTSDMMPPRA